MYTLVLKDADKADKLKQSLPPGMHLDLIDAILEDHNTSSSGGRRRRRMPPLHGKRKVKMTKMAS